MPPNNSKQGQSILIVPLIVRGELLGTIGCDVIGNHHNFTAEEIRLVETLAGMISTRIEQKHAIGCYWLLVMRYLWPIHQQRKRPIISQSSRPPFIESDAQLEKEILK